MQNSLGFIGLVKLIVPEQETCLSPAKIIMASCYPHGGLMGRTIWAVCSTEMEYTWSILPEGTYHQGLTGTQRANFIPFPVMLLYRQWCHPKLWV